MSDELFCPEHGPYPAAYGGCPVCSGRPSSPPSLSNMEAETDPGFGNYGGNAYGGDAYGADTVVEGMDRGNFGNNLEDDTVVGTSAHESLDETYVPTRRRSATEVIFWVQEGDRRGKWYPVQSGTIIGRKGTGLVLDDDQASGTHAKITVDKGQYYIWDFGSSNGTYVNGKRIREATLLEENDKVKIGKTVFVVKILDAKKKTPVSRNTTKKPKTTASKGKTTKAANSKTTAAKPTARKTTAKK
jgi:hypothetical protein